jgi:phage/plasmid-like protein (TIGR03299 family)
MAHEITSTDGAVYHAKPAWHGLGLVVADAPSPREALKLAGMGWDVIQRPLFVKDGNFEDQVETHVVNYRSDNNERLGVVSANYQPIQNGEVADFAQALSELGTEVKVESAGTIRGGKRIWFLLKGETFSVAKGDEIYPYVLLSNGHDGYGSFRVTPTTVRVVCSNTLHMVIPRSDSGELLDSALVLKHTVNVMTRVQEAKRALSMYGKAVKGVQAVADVLSAKDVNHADVQKFFLENYTVDFGDIPANPQNVWEEKKRERAHSALASFSRRFDDERSIAGASAWNMLNAYTGLIQHDRKAVGKDDESRVESRVDSNLFGLSQQRTQAALRRAYRFAVAT